VRAAWSRSLTPTYTRLQGAILRSDVAGEVQMKCLLSGMPGAPPPDFYNPIFVLNPAPECRFGMNDKLGMDDKAPAAAAAKKCAMLHFIYCPKPLLSDGALVGERASSLQTSRSTSA
jgi:hypothetical protein